jgi:hypothetical protein
LQPIPSVIIGGTQLQGFFPPMGAVGDEHIAALFAEPDAFRRLACNRKTALDRDRFTREQTRRYLLDGLRIGDLRPCFVAHASMANTPFTSVAVVTTGVASRKAGKRNRQVVGAADMP